jgi:8-oxo-dGTP diphosphatase
MMQIDGYPLNFTLCFLTRGDQVLMLYRVKPPNKHLWNGVGGHIEDGETPHASCLREVWEETGYRLESLHFAGVLTWDGYEISDGGLYIFRAEAPAGDPTGTEEGLLAWHSLEWILTSGEPVDNIPLFIGRALNDGTPMHYHFSYQGGQLVGHEYLQLPDDFPWD